MQECALAGAHVSEWRRPIVDRRQIIWMSPAGQLVVKQAAGATIEMAFVAWPAGLKPRFDFGSPYLSSDGNTWQQCFQEDGRPLRLRAARPGPAGGSPEQLSSPQHRLGKLQARDDAPENPWVDPVDAGGPGLPTRSSCPCSSRGSGPTLLCARVPSTSSIEASSASSEPYTVTFELRFLDRSHEVLRRASSAAVDDSRVRVFGPTAPSAIPTCATSRVGESARSMAGRVLSRFPSCCSGPP